jgi:hypothetical protein
MCSHMTEHTYSWNHFFCLSETYLDLSERTKKHVCKGFQGSQLSFPIENNLNLVNPKIFETLLG